MYTIILLIGCLGFFCLYNTSKKIRLVGSGVAQTWLQSHPEVAKLIGVLSLLLVVVALVLLDGPVMGMIHFFLLLMTVGSYIVGIAPFGLFRWTHLLALVAAAFIFEHLIF